MPDTRAGVRPPYTMGMLERPQANLAQRLAQRAKPRGARFILIEDDPADVQLLQEGFRGSRYEHDWHVFHAGQEALEYLRTLENPWKSPCLVLLDLNLPGMDGRQVLTELKSDPKLKGIPVIILTTSNNPADVQKAYELHANSFITKPSHLNQLHTIARRIEEYWLDTVQLPR